MNENIQKLADMINECQNIVFFGGAGVSTESGVKDYRSKDGLYNTVKEYGVSPETILSRSFFFSNPDIFYDFFRKYFIIEAEPNAAHKALAALEEMGKLKAVITQNIDRLHAAAGSKNVIELHGTTSKFYCSVCRKDEDGFTVTEVIKSGKVPRCTCGGIMKPHVVLYEEPLKEETVESAISHIENADMLIIGGTSLAVYPAAAYIRYFRGKYLVIINKSETNYDSSADLVINDSIGKVLSGAVELI